MSNRKSMPVCGRASRRTGFISERAKSEFPSLAQVTDFLCVED